MAKFILDFEVVEKHKRRMMVEANNRQEAEAKVHFEMLTRQTNDSDLDFTVIDAIEISPDLFLKFRKGAKK